MWLKTLNLLLRKNSVFDTVKHSLPCVHWKSIGRQEDGEESSNMCIERKKNIKGKGDRERKN